MQVNKEKKGGVSGTLWPGQFKLTGARRCSASSVKFREKLVQAYQEQGADLEVVFKCSDGEQRCSRLVLNCVSQFFTEQLDARDRMENEPIFNYPDYPKRIIKGFLDLMHLIDVEAGLIDLVLMIKFLNYEGKTG